MLLSAQLYSAAYVIFPQRSPNRLFRDLLQIVLAPVYKITGSYCWHLDFVVVLVWVTLLTFMTVFFFLFDGQGAIRRATLYLHMTCCGFLLPSQGKETLPKRGLFLKDRICSYRSKFFPLRYDPY